MNQQQRHKIQKILHDPKIVDDESLYTAIIIEGIDPQHLYNIHIVLDMIKLLCESRDIDYDEQFVFELLKNNIGCG